MIGHVQALLGRRLNAEHATVLASWTSRLLSSGLQFLALPLLVRSLGVDGYGVYAVTTSLLGWFMLADLGTGATLQNKISSCRASGRSPANDIVSDGLGLLASLPALAGLAALGGFVLARVIWSPRQLAWAGDWLIVVAALPFVVSALGSVAYKILYAQQQGWRANLWQAIGSVLALASTYALFRAELAPRARLACMVLAYAVPPAAVSTSLLLRALRRARAEGGRFDRAIFGRTVRRSAGFLGFGLLSLLTLQADYLILAVTVAPAEILKYNVISKVAGLAIVLFGAVLQAQWPGCAEAAARNDWRAIGGRLAGLLRIGTAMMLAFGVLYTLFQPTIMALISPKQPAGLERGVVLLYTLYLLARVWTDSHSMLLQSMGRLRIFILFVPVQAACSLLLQMVLSRAFGVAGLVGGLLASFLLTACWILPLHLRTVRRQSAAASVGTATTS